MIKPMKLTRKHFEEWGRKGGKIKTKRGAEASANNGRKGGRPKKDAGAKKDSA